MRINLNQINWNTDCAYGKPDYIRNPQRCSNRQKVARYDPAMIGTIRIFLNGWSIVFHKNGAYYLYDKSGNKEHICSYSQRFKLFDFLQSVDYQINFADTEEMGYLLFLFTAKPNVWLKIESKL